MLTLAEKADSTVLAWDPGEETVVPNNHGVLLSAFSWDTEDDTVVPGHHTTEFSAFSWDERL
jgi:hypothetical protein